MTAMIRSGSGLPSESLQTISIHVNDPAVKWVDKGEFIYNGKMYDVVSKKISGDRCIIVCINDREEETLVANYGRYRLLVTRMGSQDPAGHHRLLVHLLVKQALIPIITAASPQNPSPVLYPPTVSAIHSVPEAPSPPPPRVSC